MASILWFVLVFGFPPSEPSFYIETIEITGTRFAGREILLSQARLEEQTRYDENVLRSAVIRIRQLPFVRQATFSLKRGSRRGHYKLVIRVRENSLFIYDLVYRSTYREDRSGDPTESTAYLAGMRAFLGKGGMAYATFFPEKDRYIGGYSHFDILQKGIFFNLELAYNEPDLLTNDTGFIHNDGSWQADLALAVPFRRNQWIRLERGRSQGQTTVEIAPRPEFALRRDRETQSNTTELYWEFNTTDDPLFPNRGSILRAGFSQTVRDTHEAIVMFGDVTLEEDRAVSERSFLDADRSFSVGFGHTLTASSSAFQVIQPENRIRVLRLAADYRYDWLKGSGKQDWGDLYSGIEASYTTSKHRSTILAETLNETTETYLIEAYLVHRTRWGLLRATLRYQGSTSDPAQKFGRGAMIAPPAVGAHLG